jgi:hypothetical protein
LRYVNEKPVAEHYQEFGVKYDDGEVYDASTKEDAELQAELHRAKVVSHEVYVTEWENVE